MIVLWRVTERCNLSCGFCAFDRRVERSRRDADPREVFVFGQLLDDYRQATGDEVLVSWLGGEPLRWPPLMEMSRVFHSSFGLRVSTTTNGTALRSRAVREELRAHFAELTVSIDGLGATHERLRGWPRGFEALRTGVTALVEEGRRDGRLPLLRVNVVLMRETLPEFVPLCRELASWGIREITVNQLGGRDRPEFFPTQRLRPEDVLELSAGWDALRAELAAEGVTLRGSAAYLDRMLASARGDALPVEDCAPGERFLFVDVDGVASPCSFTREEYGIPIARIESVAALLAAPDQWRRARTVAPSASCRDCHSTQQCGKYRSSDAT